MLVCTKGEIEKTDDWIVNPLPFIQGANAAGKPEDDRESLLVFRETLTHNKGQYKVNCPPMVRGFCDSQGRVYVTEHSLGICLWSGEALSEHLSN